MTGIEKVLSWVASGEVTRREFLGRGTVSCVVLAAGPWRSIANYPEPFNIHYSQRLSNTTPTSYKAAQADTRLLETGMNRSDGSGNRVTKLLVADPYPQPNAQPNRADDLAIYICPYCGCMNRVDKKDGYRVFTCHCCGHAFRA